MAPLRRLRVTDRATGTVLGDVEPVLEPPPRPEDPARPVGAARPLVLPGDDGSVEVVVDGWRFDLVVEDAERADLRARATRAGGARGDDGPTTVRAIIPGRVVSVAVDPGDVVAAGARLLAVEAMKMENEVRAPRAGTVDRVAVAAGETVELGDVLVVLS